MSGPAAAGADRAGVTSPAGFVATGGAVGIKAGGAPDLALVATEDGRSVAAAGVFTPNRAAAPAVQASREHLGATAGRAAAVVLTSGNANAATGAPGRAAVDRLCALVGVGIGVSAAEVLVAQTGLIGVPFPIDVVSPALARVVAGRSSGGSAAAADAILTTDTVAKTVTRRAGACTVGGMAKGAAMLAPDMATMLAVLTTDADVAPDELQVLLRAAVGRTFNEMTVDGCTSTNDTVLVLASGRAGPVPTATLADVLTEACGSLAEQMVADAEGATKVVLIRVTGARTDAEAHRAARKVADSLLVKCSLNGEDPYWGRVVSELGSAGVPFDLDRVSVAYGGVVVCMAGMAAAHDTAAVRAHLSARRVELACDLGLGSGSGVVLTTDLGYGYLDENRTTS